MDPQLKSLLTSFGLSGATAIAAWASTKGIIPNDAGSQAALANTLLGAAGFAVAGVLAWYKTRQVSQPAMIQAVNKADNGVKVVADDARSAPIAAVNAPLKEPAK